VSVPARRRGGCCPPAAHGGARGGLKPGVAAVLVAAAGGLWLALAGQRGEPAAHAPAAQAVPAPAARPAAAEPAPAEAQAGTDLVAWRRDRSSLRGTELDGSWALDAQGRLQPSLALRRRFDHLLLLRDGEASAATLTRYIAQEVEAAAGAAAAQQVLDIWQRYLGLLQMSFATRVDLTRADTWGPALAERQRARRDRLGLAWAQAFYAGEEAELQALINAQAGTGGSGAALLAAAAPASGVVVLGPLGPARTALSDAQRERLAAVDAEQARWNERLAQARRDVDALRTAPHLSEPQRRQAIKDWLARDFDAPEQLRIRGLLDLPPE
jgi:lipase chaperone LimK